MKAFTYLLLFVLSCKNSVLAITPIEQIYALEFLYNATTGDKWRWKNELVFGPRWSFTLPQKDPCQDGNEVWQGITCSLSPSSCRIQVCAIIEINLKFYDLAGTLPKEMFHSLSSLQILTITDSINLVGPIPSTIGSLTNLVELNLGDNHLLGTLPPSLGQLLSLEILSLDNNLLFGSIPPEIGLLSSLSELYVYGNYLMKNIPTSLGRLSHLIALILYDNLLSGSIPSELALISSLRGLSLYNNRLSGTIPSELGLLSALQNFYIYDNTLHGSIPSELALLTAISVLDLGSNQLSGQIPREIGLMTALSLLSLRNNELNGTIPSELGSLVNLDKLYLYGNRLRGTIPSSLGFLFSLKGLVLYDNRLTGTVPSELCRLSLLSGFVLYKNFLSGSIPTEIGQLTNLQFFPFDTNLLTGPIPWQIASLRKLQFLYLNDNYFTSSIPSEIGLLTNLQEVRLYHNSFTGSIPSTISSLTSLIFLHLYDNHFSGEIKFSLVPLVSLIQFFIQENHLDGNLFSLLSSPTDTAPHLNLTNIDLSDNLFSGSIPSALFVLPYLQSISLSLNCFEHELPSAICEAKNMTVLSMDGLAAAKGCHGYTSVSFLLFETVGLGQKMDGTIPECIWMLSKLRTLNLAGNGLRGKIGDNAQMTSLVNMTLSHNYLTGKIPSWIQKKNMSLLDLSHNKLSGDLDDFKSQVEWRINLSHNRSLTPTRSLKLAVNRLSGDVSKAFSVYSDLDILSGNLFSCQNIPTKDKNSEFITCGSEEYDQTLSLMGGLVGSLLFALMLYILYFSILHVQVSATKMFKWIDLKLFHYITYLIFQATPGKLLTPAESFSNYLISLMKMVCLLCVVSWLFSFPLYILKEVAEDGRYVTHSHMYQWLWTLAFLSGPTPAILILIMTFTSLLVFSGALNYITRANLSSCRKRDQDSDGMVIDGAPVFGQQRNFYFLITVWLIFIVNFGVVGTMNGLYLWSTLVDISLAVRTWIQFGFAVLSFVWSNLILRESLPLRIRASRYGIWLSCCLSLTNNVIIPCIVTLLSSPSCYQRLLIPPEEISSSYIYALCRSFEVSADGYTCLLYTPAAMNPLQILPPFTYSYQCGSAIVTSYIPVYMYSTSLQLVSVILSTILIFTADHVIKYPSQILQRFPLVYWPDWDEDRSNSLKSSRMIRPHQILSILCSNLILLLSFGLCSPALGFYITASICFYGCFWLMVIGRYICLRKGQGIEKEIEVGEPKLRCDDEFVQLLNHQLQSLDLSDIKVCKWPVICTTCMFMTLLCWDMVGDQVGWYDAIWVPVVGSFILLLLWVWGLLLDRGVLDRYVSFQLFTPVTVSGHNMSNPPQLQVSSSNSVEFVTSSLHVIKEG